jgi:hypothetical protein
MRWVKTVMKLSIGLLVMELSRGAAEGHSRGRRDAEVWNRATGKTHEQRSYNANTYGRLLEVMGVPKSGKSY